MKLSEMSPAVRAAAMRTALDESIQNPRADEIRQELAETADFSKLSTDEWRMVVGFNAVAAAKARNSNTESVSPQVQAAAETIRTAASADLVKLDIADMRLALASRAPSILNGSKKAPNTPGSSPFFTS